MAITIILILSWIYSVIEVAMGRHIASRTNARWDRTILAWRSRIRKRSVRRLPPRQRDRQMDDQVKAYVLCAIDNMMMTMTVTCFDIFYRGGN